MDALSEISKIWISKIRIAEEEKDKKFGKFAREAMQFYTGPYDFLYDNDGSAPTSFVVEGVRSPAFRMSINKVAELVDLFLPALYDRNPQFTVNHKYLQLPPADLLGLYPPQLLQQMFQQSQQSGQPFDPLAPLQKPETELAQLRIAASLSAYYMNQSVKENDLKRNVRLALTEALIKGRGLLWTELENSPNGMMVYDKYDSVDNLVIDPDAESLHDAKWIARRRYQYIRDVEDKFRLPRGLLKGRRESYGKEAISDVADDRTAGISDRSKSYDVVETWEVYSKIGIGGNLTGFDDDMAKKLEPFGKYSYIAVSPDVDFPLNLEKSSIENISEAELGGRVSWPTPFYADMTHGWPFIHFDFHDIPRSVWPMSHIRPAMGELKALQWVTSFMVGKIKNISRDFVVVDKTVEDNIKDAIINGPDLTMLEVMSRGNKAVGDFIHFVQHPDLNRSLWEVTSMLEQMFERRTGVTDLMQGTSQGKQIRSATEATMKQQASNTRPDEMADRVESMMEIVGRNHMIAARTHLTQADIAPIFGERIEETGPEFQNGEKPKSGGPLTEMWMKLLGSQEVSQVVSEFNYEIEPGSARKHNKQQDIARANEGLQVAFGPAMQSYGQWGDPAQANYLLEKWYKANDWVDFQKGLLPDKTQEIQQMQQQAAEAEKGKNSGSSSS